MVNDVGGGGYDGLYLFFCFFCFTLLERGLKLSVIANDDV
jgi:hypothetical protein